MEKVTSFELPLPTSRTVSGPRLHSHPPALVVEYDFERDDASIEWVRIAFDDVLAFEYRQDPCCEATDVVACNRMLCCSESEWLQTMRRRWERFMGDQMQKGPFLYKHWKTYFDDGGCVDVLAASFRID